MLELLNWGFRVYVGAEQFGIFPELYALALYRQALGSWYLGATNFSSLHSFHETVFPDR